MRAHHAFVPPAGQAQLLAIAQSIPSAFIVYLVACIPVGVYAFLRSGWEEGIFSAAIFFFLSLELTMVSCSSCADVVLPYILTAHMLALSMSQVAGL